ncbi:thiamine pyrophosphate-dependent enzyme [Halocatena salina]|uniref:Thiamine pyrophosphate-dependent enzyme n=1 Tax=Halocatena salina TaxID=2934340 RepID=A0A8T9ZZ22_9EURY|nr:thiamine pyrophosphate-dependent enzyme [Halocatena salina]UPM41689.1 thiamine pyrophosphate-dependent enzyme [Halocatena salina]
MHRVIAENDVADTSFDAEEMQTILQQMVRARTFDERAVSLQRRGWMSGYPPFKGQEASQVGGAYALQETDWLVPTYRSNAMQLARGVPPSDILRFRRGYPEYHSDHERPVFPQAVPIATQTLHAVGIGMAIDYDDSDQARVLCYLGDGATSEGDFHEALNFAGVFDAPVVFFCENNHWAISLPRDRQTAAPTIAAKADAYGIEGTRVDGNDPLAVAETVERALNRAATDEPVLVESLTYRQGPHTTSDDPERYRDDVDLPEWRTADPIERFEGYLLDNGVIEDGFVDDVEQQTREQISSAVDTIEETETESPEDVFDSVYADLPPRLQQQRTHFFPLG